MIDEFFPLLHGGIYSGQPEKFFPPPSKILPCFCGFFAIFKLPEGISTCVLSLFSYFLLFPPFPFLFFKSSFKFFPVFQFGQKIPPPQGGGMPRICIPDREQKRVFFYFPPSLLAILVHSVKFIPGEDWSFVMLTLDSIVQLKEESVVIL